jgi:hypothetical protein
MRRRSFRVVVALSGCLLGLSLDLGPARRALRPLALEKPRLSGHLLHRAAQATVLTTLMSLIVSVANGMTDDQQLAKLISNVAPIFLDRGLGPPAARTCCQHPHALVPMLYNIACRYPVLMKELIATPANPPPAAAARAAPAASVSRTAAAPAAAGRPRRR